MFIFKLQMKKIHRSIIDLIFQFSVFLLRCVKSLSFSMFHRACTVVIFVVITLHQTGERYISTFVGIFKFSSTDSILNICNSFLLDFLILKYAQTNRIPFPYIPAFSEFLSISMTF